jgi:protein SCO1/2
MVMKRFRKIRPAPLREVAAIVLAAASLVAWGIGGAHAQPAGPPPDELQGVGVTEHLGGRIPPGLSFTDDLGRSVTFGDIFAGERPVLLTLNYSGCPMLCSLILNGLLEGLRGMAWSAGREFEIVTVSIDPRETTPTARRTKERYLRDYGRPIADEGWRFLTGREAEIQALAGAAGFGYRYVESRDEYAHAAVVIVCTPDGRISRYLYGVVYDPQTLRLSLVEASEGKIGSALDQLLLFCFHYDAEAGRYGPAAARLLRAGAGLTVIVLGTTLMVYWRRDLRRKRVSPTCTG